MLKHSKAPLKSHDWKGELACLYGELSLYFPLQVRLEVSNITWSCGTP